jgi:hypothetical protein
MTGQHQSLSFDAIHDADAGEWVATSAAGRITTEAPSREALIERLKVIVPDVLETETRPRTAGRVDRHQLARAADRRADRADGRIARGGLLP